MSSITTTDIAAHIRRELKAAFPGVKFTVRCGRGTGSAWIDVDWTDGPDRAAVESITNPVRYAKTLTVATKGGKVTGWPVLDGISVQRAFSEQALAEARTLWEQATGQTVEAAERHWQDWATVGGEQIRPGNVHTQIMEIAALVVIPSRKAAA